MSDATEPHPEYEPTDEGFTEEVKKLLRHAREQRERADRREPDPEDRWAPS